MSIRRTIILLTVPLFLALAVVNGALLYVQEKAEMSEALGEQALSAAYTSAEFIASMERPHDELAEPLRVRALKRAAQQITGLEALYLVLPGAPPRALVPPSQPWLPGGLERPEKAHILPLATDAAGRHHVVALAPTTGGGFVAARIDAEPMFARMAAIQRAILLIVLVAGLTAAVLAWFVARRIVRELERNHRAIVALAAGQEPPDSDDLTIREVRDLAGAVRLMEASRRAAEQRSRRVTARRDRERTVDTALAARRDARFAPVSATIAGVQVAARICGAAPMGCFFALCAGADRGIVLVGRCSGATPQEAFTRAVAARRFLEEKMPTMPADACIAAAKAEHAIEEIRATEWTNDGAADAASASAVLLALTDAETAGHAERYTDSNRDAAPDALLDGLELLLEPDGVFAAVSLP
jgi:hypothetical protein